eukprot:6005781-Prymnesium_polylepis.2
MNEGTDLQTRCGGLCSGQAHPPARGEAQKCAFACRIGELKSRISRSRTNEKFTTVAQRTVYGGCPWIEPPAETKKAQVSV